MEIVLKTTNQKQSMSILRYLKAHGAKYSTHIEDGVNLNDTYVIEIENDDHSINVLSDLLNLNQIFMGYRAGVYVNGTFINDLPKFYGYIKEDIYEYLPSIKWLVNNEKIYEEDVDITFLGGWGPRIKFTAREFREFMTLYISDFEKYGRQFWCSYPKGYNLLYSKKWLKDVYNNNADKVIEWG